MPIAHPGMLWLEEWLLLVFKTAIL
jgi:hypothetical protein